MKIIISGSFYFHIRETLLSDVKFTGLNACCQLCDLQIENEAQIS